MIIDWDLALRRAGNNQEIANEILGMIIQRLPQELEQIQVAYQEKNYPEMFHLAHKLHGALSYSGATRLRTVVAELEADLKADVIDDLPDKLKKLKDEVNILLEYYEGERFLN